MLRAFACVVFVAIVLPFPCLVGANWPVARYQNGTVGLRNDDGEVHVQSKKLRVNGDITVEGDFFCFLMQILRQIWPFFNRFWPKKPKFSRNNLRFFHFLMGFFKF